MSHFEYRDGRLFAEDVAISDIAAAVKTPFYCYSSSTLIDQYQAMADALAVVNGRICYAIKANSNQAVIRTLAKLGAGADVVSEGEARRALAAGISASEIVFSGVGKTRSEMQFAINAGIGQFNVESVGELDVLNEVAIEQEKIATVVFRVNPDVDAHTHDKISTGRKEDKFGIDIDLAPDLYEHAMELPGILPVGLAVHIGSQLTTLNPFQEAFSRVAAMVNALRAAGFDVNRLDLGGGLGIVYDGETPPEPQDYAAVVAETVGDLDVELTFEPGRVLVGNAGLLVTSVIQVKETATKRFVVVDAAMNDFIRPTLYDAIHAVATVAERSGESTYVSEIVGPVCETGDILASNTHLPTLEENDLICFKSAGAYGAVMASSYNTRPPIPEIMVNHRDFSVIRPRPSYDEILSLDHLPHWL
ncbi:MAG: diaminopimelate decarboxylase [Rhodospirillaceae bacterium]|nr:diaminopimelate decarboxylase [Rhodospirillaceae bacterium]|tara:strand:+ start:6649 stop:7905 length:1257 start_codon:yes stop_codon:yes gene_type:complete